MTQFEYKVVPAPAKGRKARGVKGPEGRFANALEMLMNEMAAEGWEFLRAETLPSEERSGLTASTTIYRSVLVFRRARTDTVDAFEPRLLDHPAPSELPPPDTESDAPAAKDQNETTAAEETGPQPLVLSKEDATGASAVSDPDEADNVSDISVALKARAEKPPET